MATSCPSPLPQCKVLLKRNRLSKSLRLYLAQILTTSKSDDTKPGSCRLYSCSFLTLYQLQPPLRLQLWLQLAVSAATAASTAVAACCVRRSYSNGCSCSLLYQLSAYLHESFTRFDLGRERSEKSEQQRGSGARQGVGGRRAAGGVQGKTAATSEIAIRPSQGRPPKGYERVGPGKLEQYFRESMATP
jgi:hypothetical protein